MNFYKHAYRLKKSVIMTDTPNTYYAILRTLWNEIQHAAVLYPIANIKTQLLRRASWHEKQLMSPSKPIVLGDVTLQYCEHRDNFEYRN